VQATVASYEAESRSGTVVTDEGKTLTFAGETLAEHLRHLRPGQRVHIQTDGEQVTSVRLWQ
jgi:2-phospho-L-lactate guanylyltransferase